MKNVTCCTEDCDASALSVAEALRQLECALQPIHEPEFILINHALGRILADNVLSQTNVPAFPNSAMDGYAVRGADLATTGDTQLTMIGTAFAGKPYPGSVQLGQCVRIFTGAVLPTGTDTVIMQEQVQILAANLITISAGQKIGQHVRPIGEDIQSGQQVLTTGKRLSPADIGLLASLGIAQVKVNRRLRVAFFSTGDELCKIGEKLQLGQIYDSNRYIIQALLSRLDVDCVDLGIVRDDRIAIEQAFLTAAQNSDVIISSGGVSVGDADYVIETLQRLGAVNFWKLAIKPGKPLTVGKIHNKVFFGLPGNPVSAMVTFLQLVQPALQHIMGETKHIPLRFTVPCLSSLKKQPGRMEFQRGILEPDAQGQLVVRSTGKQGSAVLTSMSQANCFIVLPVECSQVAVGDNVLVEPFVL